MRNFVDADGNSGGGGGGFAGYSAPRSRSAGACYAFQRGECDRGDSCRYSHDAAGATPGADFAPRERRPRGVCYAFQKGECDRGDACRFSHEASAEGGAEFSTY